MPGCEPNILAGGFRGARAGNRAVFGAKAGVHTLRRDVHARARGLKCLSKEDVHGEPAGEIVKRPWGERSFYARDPFQNRLCFVDAQTLFTGR